MDNVPAAPPVPAPTPVSDPASLINPNIAPPPPPPISTAVAAPKSGLPILKILLIIVILLILGGAPAIYYLFFSKPKAPANEVAVNQASESALPKPTVGASPTPTPPVLFLTLNSPQAGDVISNSEVTVNGKTLPGATVVIYTDTTQTAIEADTTGIFQTNLLLDNGINSLTVTAYSDKGEEKTLNVNIVRDI